MPGAKNSNTNLLSRILSIFNNTLNAYETYRQAHFKDITYTTMTVCFFGDRTLHEQYDTCNNHDFSQKERKSKIRKEKDLLRKIDTLQEKHVCAFIKNFFSEEKTDLWIALLDAHFQTNSQKDSAVDDIFYDLSQPAQICNNINSFYHAINPYPWYVFEPCQTGDEDSDEDSEISSTMAKQLLFLFIHEVYNHKTAAAFLPYNIFEEKHCTRLAVSGSVNPYFGEYLRLHKPLGIRNSHLLSKPIHDYDNLLGSRLKELRTAQGISQKTLAARLQTEGFEFTDLTILRIEQGKRFVPDYEIVAIANYFHISTDYLLGLTDTK